MYLSDDQIREVEDRFGKPVCIARVVEMNDEQIAKVKIGTRAGRRHDVTLFILHGGRVVMTSKPGYPVGAYRAPSGGVEVGESFEAGALREAREETGLDIEIVRYLIRCNVVFRTSTESIPWTTHAVLAVSHSADLKPEDTHEIAEARWSDFGEVLGPIQSALRASGSPGLIYRAELDELALKLIDDLSNTFDRTIGERAISH